MDWSYILKQSGIPEPPGYVEAVQAMQQKPKKQRKKGKKR